MVKGVIAIYDYETDYAYNLMDYLNRKGDFPLEARVFTNEVSLLEYTKKGKVDILLVGEDIVLSKVDSEKVGMRILLSEQRSEVDGEEYVVYKFQSAENMMNQVLLYYSEQDNHKISPRIKGDSSTNVIGVFSCGSGIYKTVFSLALGQFLGVDKSVLYLNFEPLNGLTKLFNKEAKGGLSDLLYFVSQGKENIDLKLRTMVGSIGNLDYLSSVSCFTELYDIERGYLINLIEQMKEQSNYNSIILDIGLLGNNTITLLKLCDKVYLSKALDEFEISKEREFLNYLQEREKELYEKAISIQMPIDNNLVHGEYNIEHLCSGELRKYIERIEGCG